MKPSILIIGSGAVGAVYGQALIRAGCQVTFLVRSIDSKNATMPRTLYRYQTLFGGYREEIQNISTIERIESTYDQVWLCTPSTALDSPWLQEQLTHIGTAPLVVWTPGIQDIDSLRTVCAGPICRGLIGLLSFQTPLPGETQPPSGIAYIAPPGSAILQNDTLGRSAAQLLKAGKLPAHTHGNVAQLEIKLATLMICTMAALEQQQWSIKTLTSSPGLRVATKAALEAKQANFQHLNIKVQRIAPGHHLIALALKASLAIAPYAVPIPLEKFLHYHFAKVGQQTRHIVKGWIALCRQYALPCQHLEQLLAGLS